MKRTAMSLLVIMMIFMLSGCGNGGGGAETNQKPGESEGTQYAQALDVLNEIRQAYEEEDLFSIYGGDQENAVMDAPGKFDISKTEELGITLGLPEDLWDDIDDAASMVHMMNANTFTGAVYHLKDGTDINDFADTVKSNIMGMQWICGQPDTLIIMEVKGNYVITAYGNAEIIETFKNNALSALEDSQTVVEAPIS